MHLSVLMQFVIEVWSTVLNTLCSLWGYTLDLEGLNFFSSLILASRLPCAVSKNYIYTNVYLFSIAYDKIAQSDSFACFWK